MTTGQFLSHIEHLGIRLWLELGQLRYQAPKNVLTPDLRAEIVRRKPDLIALLNRTQKASTEPEFVRIGRDTVPRLPLSFAQQRLWFLESFEAKQFSFYNVPTLLRMYGKLDRNALEEAFRRLEIRHEVLRTSFPDVDGQPYQHIHSPRFKLDWVDLSALSVADREREVARISIEEASHRFDLAEGPLWRACLVRLEMEKHVLFYTLHHTIADGWSMGIFTRELSATYAHLCNGGPLDLPPLPVQYADFALWQRHWLQGDVLAEHVAYWQKQLAAAPSLLTLPTDKPRPAVQSGQGNRVMFSLRPDLSQALKEFARRSKVTLFMLLESAFAILLSRYSGQTDILVGTPIANRQVAETDQLIGIFPNIIVIRHDLAANPPFRAFLDQVRQTALDGFQYQALPFEMLVEAIQPERSLAYSPVFQAMFNLLNFRDMSLSLPELRVERDEIEYVFAKHDLQLSMHESEVLISGALEYNGDIFEQATMERFVGHYQVLLDAIVTHPDTPCANLPLLDAAERQKLLVDWNQSQAPVQSDSCIHDLIEAQAEQVPEKIALWFEQQRISHNELNRRANRIAHSLRSHGVRPEMIVGIWVEDPVSFVICLLGVLKAGAAYMPLDPSYPTDRLGYMLQDAQVAALLTDAPEGSSESLLRNVSPAPRLLIFSDIERAEGKDELANPTWVNTPDNAAYVIYTSGSTGKPKGTLLQHRGLVNFTLSMIEQCAVTHESRVCQFAAWGFDASVLEIMLALVAGATLVLVPRDVRTNLAALVKLLNEARVSVATLPPSLLEVLDPVDLPWLTTIFSVGEACSWEVASRWSVERRFANGYGPTEATIGATFHRVDAQTDKTPTVLIGRPYSNVEVYVLDAQGEPAPIGVPGEVYIGGMGLARGYLHNRRLTAERFLPNPFIGELRGAGSSRLYRTGDLARYLPSGQLEYVGRIDHQVKLRGFRIELGEIEAALRQHSAVAKAAVIVWGEGSTDKRLVAYVVLRPDIDLPDVGGALRVFLSAHLPEYMVPATFVRLDDLPLTAHKKVDRQALPPPTDGQANRALRVAPRNGIERQLCEIWRQLLRVADVGIHDHFFELGGHSLLAAQMAAHIRKRMHIELSLRDIFAYPTIAGLSSRFTTSRIELPPLTRISRESNKPIPLSFSQQRLWFLSQLEGNSHVYNMPNAFRLHGTLNQAALEEAFRILEMRHESLRTSFPEFEGRPHQHIHPPRFTLNFVDHSDLAESDRTSIITQHCREETNFVFDLVNGPLWRVCLVRLGATDHLLLITLHHTISDGWSMGILMRELSVLYAHARTQSVESARSALAPLPIQYADYAVWQRNWLQGEVLESFLNYWKKELEGAPPLLMLPTDKPRPAVQTGQGDHVPFSLNPAHTEALEKFARQYDATLFMVLEAAFAVLLSRYSGQQDILIGTPVANRPVAEAEPLIGLFLNAIVLRNDLSQNPTFLDLLVQVRQTALDGFERQALPFEMLVDALQPERSLAHSPIFQVMLNLVNSPSDSFALADLRAESVEGEYQVAKHDLVLVMWKHDAQLCGAFEYSTDLFVRGTIERMAEHFQVLLEAIVADATRRIGELPMLTTPERHQLLVDWNPRSNGPAGDACYQTLFEAQVKRTPNAKAVFWQNSPESPILSLSYGDLNVRANQLAHMLRARGVVPNYGAESIVGVCLDRSPDTTVSFLAIFKAGAAYMPIDPALPGERIKSLLECSKAALIITTKAYADRFSGPTICIDEEAESLAAQSTANPENNSTPAHLAYVLFTSGSTGVPKGVMIEHRGMVNNLRAKIQDHGLTERDKLAQTAPVGFDISVWQFLAALLVGGSVRIFSDDIAKDPVELVRRTNDEGITVLEVVPSLFRAMLDELPIATPNRPTFAALRWLSLTGEALPVDLCNRWLKDYPHIPILNAYGPAECSDDATHYLVTEPLPLDTDIVPIGKALPHVRLYILDKHLQPVPVGVPGELCIGGIGVGRGYLHDPDRTAEVFLRDPFVTDPNARLYKTGDGARYRADGTLEFLGRLDHQVKLRGFRIELGEIEATLDQHSTVEKSIAAIHAPAQGEKVLVAYVTLDSSTEDSVDTLRHQWREYLTERLPAYMVPNHFVVLESLPLTSNGKIDRKNLPALEITQTRKTSGQKPPTTPTEMQLVEIWREVLQIEHVGVDESFFTIGGHSLLATQVMSRIRQRLAVELPLRTIFSAPTIATLAEQVDQRMLGRMIQQLPTDTMTAREEIDI